MLMRPEVCLGRFFILLFITNPFSSLKRLFLRDKSEEVKNMT